ncbi:hypothetical protein Tco_0758556 [Tanacetum coccineum]
MYRSMIGSLMYLTSSRPDIMFAVCACARYQVNPKVSHLYVVKRIFRYLKGHPKLGLWYPKDSPFDLVAYTNSDYAGASLDRKSTTGGYQFLRNRLISWQCKKQTVVANSITEAEYVAASSCSYGTAIICLATNQKFNFSKFIFESMVKNLDNMGKILMYPRKPKRKDTQIPQSSGPTEHVADEAVHKEKGDSLVRAATTSSSLRASGKWCQETMGDTIAQTRFKNVSKLSNDPLLARVLNLEKTKTSQGNEITSLKRRVRKLKKKGRSRTHKLKRLYKVGLTDRVDSSKEEVLGKDASKQGRINDIDNDEYITLVNVQDDAEMFAVNTLVGDDVSAKQEVATKDVNLTVDEDDIQAKIEADHELAQRLQVEEPDLVDAKVDDDQEADKIKELMEIVPDEEEIAIDAIPLATKSLSIVD